MAKPGSQPKPSGSIDRGFHVALLSAAPNVHGESDGLSEAQAHYWTQRVARLRPELLALLRRPFDPRIILLEWRPFYERYFPELHFNPGSLVLGEHPIGLDRVTVMAGGLTLPRIAEVFETHYSCFIMLEDEYVHDRQLTEGYLFRQRDCAAPEREWEGRSARWLRQNKPNMGQITLPEYLIFLLKWLDEGHELPYHEGCTVCGGTLNSQGFVPVVSAEWRVECGLAQRGKPAVSYRVADDTYAPTIYRVREVGGVVNIPTYT